MMETNLSLKKKNGKLLKNQSIQLKLNDSLFVLTQWDKIDL